MIEKLFEGVQQELPKGEVLSLFFDIKNKLIKVRVRDTYSAGGLYEKKTSTKVFMNHIIEITLYVLKEPKAVKKTIFMNSPEYNWLVSVGDGQFYPYPRYIREELV